MSGPQSTQDPQKPALRIQSQQSSHQAAIAPSSPGATAVALLWIVGFLVFFFRAELSNNRSIDRIEVLMVSPELIAGPFSETPRGEAGSGASVAWSHLADRVDFVGYAFLILGAAAGWGRLILASIRGVRPCGLVESEVLGIGLGLIGLSLSTLALGLAGIVDQRVGWAVIALGMLLNVVVRAFLPRQSKTGGNFWGHPLHRDASGLRRCWLFAATVTPFLFIMLLGALLPSSDFDVNEYHFQGPKEYLQAGRIGFLPHNVYTSFPFATEMLTLFSMTVRGDWYRGAVVGKCVLACFIPLTAAALFALGRRLFNPLAGGLAAIVWLSAPWAYRISAIAYAEGGLCFYVTAALLGYVLWYQGRREMGDTPAEPTSLDSNTQSVATGKLDERLDWSGPLLTGLFAGGAMSCKYPGLVSSVAPLFVATMWTLGSRREEPGPGGNPGPTGVWRRWRGAVIFLAGVTLAVGPWLLKNLVETGNPVYPLGWTIFGGADWSADLNARWRKAHSSSDFSAGSVVALLLEIAAKNDWQSPFLFSLAPLTLFFRESRPAALRLWLYVGWLFVSCWALTHRLDRFWVPMLPIVALLAGAGGSVFWTRLAIRQDSNEGGRVGGGTLLRVGLVGLAALLLFYNLTFSVSPLGGNNSFLSSFSDASRFVARLTAPELVHLNETLPEGSKVLSVGDAEMFESRFPVAYNTVFDQSLFEDWLGDPDWTGESTNRPFRDWKSIQNQLAAEGITHIYVNWLEILRYRSPGNYGYTQFVSPSRFEQLRELGVLGPPWSIPGAGLPLDELDAGKLEVVRSWGNEPVTRLAGKEVLKTFEVFPVLRTR